MAQKNIANRRDIDPGVLRQRRDFYAIAIGLLLFNLAGGHMNSDMTFGAILPIKLAIPQVLFWAAWAGFVYFLWRFWLLAPPAWSQFREEFSLQAGNRTAIKQFIRGLLVGLNNPGHQGQIDALMLPQARVNPGVIWHDRKFQVDYNDVQCVGVGGFPNPLGARTVDISSSERWRFRLALVRALAFAIWYERSFSDYVAPYLFAGVCVIVQIARLIIDPSFLG